MNENHIFIDTNVIIGAFSFLELENKTFQKDYNCLKFLFSLKGKRLYISSLTVAQFVSIFQKRAENSNLKKYISLFLSKFTILDFRTKDVAELLSPNYDDVDLEDTIQYVISRKGKCQSIITNNVKDFRKNAYLGLTVFSPKEYRKINW